MNNNDEAAPTIGQGGPRELHYSQNSVPNAADEYHGAHACPACGSQWDAILFRSTDCNRCATPGVPVLPPEVDDERRVFTLWDALWERREARRAARTAAPNIGAHSGDVRLRLRGLVNAILQAPGGKRNEILHWGACRAGEMIAAGELDEQTAVAVLRDVGLDVGLTALEVGGARRGTIGSGLRKGKAGGAAS